MKTEFMSKYSFTFTNIKHIRSNSMTFHHIQTTGLVLGNALPELQEIMKLQQQGYKVIMTTFYNHFLSCIVGKCKWKKHVILKKVPLFATVTDEAFTLLVLENNWGVWLVEDTKEYFIKNKKEQDNKQNRTMDFILDMLKVLPNLEGGVWKVSRDSITFVILSGMIIL